jgi:predicted dehydrogenase
MSGEVKLCLIGAGGHSTRNIYPSLYRLEGVSIAANCDLSEDAARAVAKRFGTARSYGDIHQILKQEQADAAIVCTGAAGHAAIAVDLLNAGVRVYTEKPTPPSLEGALKILDAQRRSGKICMTACKKRFAPAYVRAKKLIELPDFGTRGGLNIIRSSAGPAWMNWVMGSTDTRRVVEPYVLGLIDRSPARLGLLLRRFTAATPGHDLEDRGFALKSLLESTILGHQDAIRPFRRGRNLE